MAGILKQPGPFAITPHKVSLCILFKNLRSSNSSPNTITRFSSLKSGDQEALTKLFAGKDKSEKAGEATEDIQNEKQDTEESCSKKRKLSTSEVNITFSVSDVKSTYKDATLLPKWKAFQTVIFLEGDDGLQDSSKIAAFDFDGCLAKMM
ncbi:unnamed protein product [Vicia faba]|uniref:Uncharacterized protein n=1 Tax=Vicia faba TaxID=3906 RepID=A0AAV0ZVV2_VICFA|nr:unnamed protein product [Vicia faba]